jgi:hypothetical protein
LLRSSQVVGSTAADDDDVGQPLLGLGHAREVAEMLVSEPGPVFLHQLRRVGEEFGQSSQLRSVCHDRGFPQSCRLSDLLLSEVAKKSEVRRVGRHDVIIAAEGAAGSAQRWVAPRDRRCVDDRRRRLAELEKAVEEAT